MRPWFTIVIILILGGILVALSLPAISVRIGRTETTETLSNCRQLQIAVAEYIKQNNRSPTTLSTLLTTGFVDEKLFQKLTGAKGLYLIYFRQDMNKEDIFIEVFLPKAHITMTSGGDGQVSPVKHHNNKQK